ncbi:MAG: hypothetical protein R3D67_15650 [Hyphomicrobiaceae bacterium]
MQPGVEAGLGVGGDIVAPTGRQGREDRTVSGALKSPVRIMGSVPSASISFFTAAV